MYKSIFALLVAAFSLSFTTEPVPRVALVSSHEALDADFIDLKEGLFLLHEGELQSLFVEVEARSVSGKKSKRESSQKEKIKGVKYDLKFEIRLVSTGKLIHREKVFITRWDDGFLDTWNTKPYVQVGKYQFQLHSSE